MLYKCSSVVVLCLMISSIALADLRDITQSKAPEKLYLSITESGQNEFIVSRFRRLLLKKIVELGKYEFQLASVDAIGAMDVGAKLLKIKFQPVVGKSDMLTMYYSLTSYQDGKKSNNEKNKVVLKDTQLLSSGIDKIVDILKE